MEGEESSRRFFRREGKSCVKNIDYLGEGFEKKISLTEEEKEEMLTVEDEDEVYDESIQRSLIGSLLTDKAYRCDFMKSTIIKAWNLAQKVEVKDIAKNLYMFTFDRMADKEKVCKYGPWNFDNYLLLLEEPNKEINQKSMKFEEACFWIQVHNLPLKAMKKSVAIAIENSCGKLVLVDETKQRAKWSIRVRVDIRKPLRRGTMIALPGGDKMWADFKYERRPKVCKWCGILGHMETNCGSKKDEGRGQYEEMRANKESTKSRFFEGKRSDSYSSSTNYTQRSSDREAYKEDVDTSFKRREEEHEVLNDESSSRIEGEGEGRGCSFLHSK